MKIEKAPVTLEIKITEEHIRKGIPRNAKHCPIALALKDMGYENAAAGVAAVRAGDHMYRLPSSAVTFVMVFDDVAANIRRTISPFEFTLDEVLE